MSDWNQQVIDEFRANGGEVKMNGFGRSLVLVHHLGARSGQERINPVVAIPQDDRSWLIAASAAGADQNPDWYHNLLAHPEVDVETPAGTVPVRAVELIGDDRDAGWNQFTAMSDGFADYERKTDRVIPVLKLQRR